MALPTRLLAMIAAPLLTVFAATGTHASEVFSDDFEAGAAAEWGNEIGEWTAESGAYHATLPSNNPPTVSSLPFTQRNLAVDVDINDVADGGIWLRAEFEDGTGLLLNGVVLVTGGFYSSHTGFYWHIIEGGAYSAALEVSDLGLFETGISDVTLHVRVNGYTYEVFLDDAPEPASTLVTDMFCEGQVGLYDFSDQTFDNFVLTALPVTPDIDGNGYVDFGDILQILSNWGCEGCCLADVNGNERVDFADLLEVLGGWGEV